MTLQVGDVVTVGRGCMNNPAGARAVVIEQYELHPGRPGWSLLFENGAYDGFSADDCRLFGVALDHHDERWADYEFVSAIRVFQDWRAGRFSAVWSPAVA